MASGGAFEAKERLPSDMQPRTTLVVGRHGVFSERVVSQVPPSATRRMVDTRDLQVLPPKDSHSGAEEKRKREACREHRGHSQ